DLRKHLRPVEPRLSRFADHAGQREVRSEVRGQIAEVKTLPERFLPLQSDLSPLQWLQWPRARCKSIPSHGVRKSRGLSVQAESGGAGHGAWEISPATG